MKTMKRSLALLFAAFAVFFSFHENTRAQSNSFGSNAEGMTLSPPLFEMTLKPGEETAHIIRITNPTKNLIELYPSAGNFTASGEGGEPKYEIGEKTIENNSQFSIANWVSFFEPKVALLPEQVVEFRFRIKVPENAEPGGHYGVVFLGTKPPEDKTDSSQVSLSTMVGSLLLVRVPGDVHEEASIDEFSIPWFFFSPPIDFNVYLKNTGNVHVRPKGDVTVLNWRGREETRIDINPTKGSILPESRRKFDALWNPEAKYFWETPLGRLYATLKIDYGEDHQELSRTVIFWIIPKWLIITVSLLFLLIIIFIIFFIIRRKRRKQMLQQRNGGFFPAFGKKPSFKNRSTQLENNAIQSVEKNQKPETEDWRHTTIKDGASNESESTPYFNTQPKDPVSMHPHSYTDTTQPFNHSATQPYSQSALQKIYKSSTQPKQIPQAQAPHPTQTSFQTLPARGKKKRLI